MNIQTERRDDQTAQLIVEVDVERLEQAKKNAARKLARQVNIPGFRKGKATYRVLIQNGLEPQILMDAIDELGQEIYKEALEQSELLPYGPGSFDDYKIEPTPTFIYSVPLQPSVTLNDYRSVRAEYTLPELSDEAVDDAMERLRQQEALVEDSGSPAVLGNRITIDIHSEFADEPPMVIVDKAAGEAEAQTEATTPSQPEKGAMFMHEHGAQILLGSENDPVLPGFSEAMVGVNPGEDREFELTVPMEGEEYEGITGRKIKFNIHVEKVEVVTIPELNDDFAAKVTETEDEPLTLLQLRSRMQESLEAELKRRVDDTYASQVLTEMVEKADIAYPEAMVQDQIDDMVKTLDQNLRQQGLALETYLRVTQMKVEDLKEQYREQAEDTLARSLVLREIVEAEKLTASDEDINKRIEEMLVQFGEQAEMIRPMFDTPNMRSSLEDDILQQKVMQRIIAIGKGEAPELTEDVQNNEQAVVESPEEAAPSEEPAIEADDSE